MVRVNTALTTKPIVLMAGEGDIKQIYRQMTYPHPALSHANYPFYTPGGEDKRWVGTAELEEEGMQWVGGLM